MVNVVISSLRGRPSNGLGARPHAREKGGEERVPLPPSSRASRASHAWAQNSLSLPFEMPATRLVIISRTIEKKMERFNRNTEHRDSCKPFRIL